MNTMLTSLATWTSYVVILIVVFILLSQSLPPLWVLILLLGTVALNAFLHSLIKWRCRKHNSN